ncbi:CDP-glycerol glycerophosphotransferase family protein [Glutamicibacter protophormiae]|uniref:bifunctional glycosyltransferase/CDP-glycerol:glycerophosphate glycerophosphotransferase n=1 Tax=Glutamicibacter protophormiae TaxID=37930 RepID=UPI002A822759|nr:glycosyltransferase [Glutamicibacter protophormiae]WPR66181.1 CDP-glycerol glycerophosphotransferase family protein [Glutamicibacter protophormiae]
MQASNSTAPLESAEPVISIISAVYNVAEYLPAYLESLDAQDVDPAKFEVILVSDGSPDESEKLIRDWMSSSPVQARLLTKENGGQASARNQGLGVARGTWVTFCDPDDFLDPAYLSEVFTNIELHADNPPAMFATRLVSYLEATDTYSHNHPLKRRFRDGTRVVNLDRSPDFFHMHGPTAIVNRLAAERMSLRFAEALRFSFEDAHYVASYLLAQPVPTIGYVDTAIYNYRIRAARNSSVQIGATKPEKYTEVLEHGHLDLIAKCQIAGQAVPKWLQFMMLYDTLWYFRGDRRVGAPSKQLTDQHLDIFHGHMSKIMAEIDDESINDFEVMPTDGDLRNALLLGYRHPNHRPSQINIVEHDVQREMTRLEYLYSGQPPQEQIIYRGREVTPLITKSQAVRLMGRDLFFRRHIWIPSSGTFSVHLDGAMIPLAFGRTPRPVYTIRPVQVQRHFVHDSASKAITVRGQKSSNRIKRAIGLAEFVFRERLSRVRRSLPQRKSQMRRLQDYISSPPAAFRYSGAWVLMDRPASANDNAEHFYRYLRTSRPNVNAWFVLDKDSPDWQRLADDGFKLLEYGSRGHYASLAHAVVYASSHLDRFVTSPFPKGLKITPRWKFVFLQHGVTLHDQSAWFNGKKIDLLTTATRDEHESIVGDGNTYKFTAKEVVLTGFPRHDALRPYIGHSASGSLKTIVVSPTWRAGLLTAADELGNRELLPGFKDSTYARALSSILGSARYIDRLAEQGYRLAYLPHPSMTVATAQLDTDSRVEILSWQGGTFADILAQADVWVTDYSSTAFEAGYAGVPVVYFQFDQAEMASGLHIYDSGYFSFQRDGFGPVVTDEYELLQALAGLNSDAIRNIYASRAAETFPHRDADNAARVYRAINAILKKTAAGKILESQEKK